MKKFIYLTIIGLAMIGCSVDEMDTESDLTSINASFVDDPEIEICGTTTSHNFGTEGTITVGNDEENLYITVASSAGNMINKTFLHIADDPTSFPTVGQGNLPPGQMDYQIELNPVNNTYTFTFSREELNLVDNCISIASMTSFTSGKSGWAGDQMVNNGNWSYFNYCFETCELEEPPVCPEDIFNILCSSEIDNPTLQGFTNYYRSLIFLNTDLTNITGTFNPTLADLHQIFLNSDGTGTFTTNYTFSNESCGEVTIAVSVEIINCE